LGALNGSRNFNLTARVGNGIAVEGMGIGLNESFLEKDKDLRAMS
jgi:hypothetical protein